MTLARGKTANPVRPELPEWLRRVDPFAWFPVGAVLIAAVLCVFMENFWWAVGFLVLAAAIVALEAAVFSRNQADSTTPAPAPRATGPIAAAHPVPAPRMSAQLDGPTERMRPVAAPKAAASTR